MSVMLLLAGLKARLYYWARSFSPVNGLCAEAALTLRMLANKLSNGDIDKSNSLNDEALVNYYHGIQAHLIRVGRKSE